MPEHDHNGRLCPTCTVERFQAIRRAPRARVTAELVARTIRRQLLGDVWAAALEHGISYEHALRIRRGWRGAGRQVETIAYRSRGYYGTPELGSHKVGELHDGRLDLLELYGWAVVDGELVDANLDALETAEAIG